MEIITLPIAAGETKVVHTAGEYFEIIESVDPVDVVLYEPQSSAQSSAIQAVSGIYMRVPFSTVNIRSATTQTLRILVGEKEGGAKRLTGDVTIQGTVPVSLSETVDVSEAYNPLKLLTYEQWASNSGRMYVFSLDLVYELLSPGEYFGQGIIYNPIGSGKSMMLLKGSRIGSKDADCTPGIFVGSVVVSDPGLQRAKSTANTSITPSFAVASRATGVLDDVCDFVLSNIIGVGVREVQGAWQWSVIDQDIIIKPGFAIVFNSDASTNTNELSVNAKFIEME